MNIDIYQLKIKIVSKIPNSPLIELTSNILYSETKTSSITLSEYPYFTDSKLFPINYLQNLKYEELLNIFFNKETFTKMINNNGNDKEKDTKNNKTKKKKVL